MHAYTTHTECLVAVYTIMLYPKKHWDPTQYSLGVGQKKNTAGLRTNLQEAVLMSHR